MKGKTIRLNDEYVYLLKIPTSVTEGEMPLHDKIILKLQERIEELEKFIPNESKTVNRNENAEEVCDLCGAKMIDIPKTLYEWRCPNLYCDAN